MRNLPLDFRNRDLLSACIGILIAFGCLSCAPTDLEDPQKAYELVQEKGALLLDVRTVNEYQAGHLPDAKNVPVSRIPEEMEQIRNWVDGDLSHPVVVYCTAGVRAARAKKALERAGFERVVNLGGLNDWPER